MRSAGVVEQQSTKQEAHLRIRVCSEVSVEEAAAAVQQHLQLSCVCDVAIVNKVHAQGAVHKERLGFLD